MLRYLGALQHLRSKKCLVFGSCCWICNSTNQIKKLLEDAKAEPVKTMEWQLKPSQAEEAALVLAGEEFAKLVK